MAVVFNPFTGTFDFTGSSGGGGGTISGTIADTQIAFGTAVDTIGGSADLTWQQGQLTPGNFWDEGLANTLTLAPSADSGNYDTHVGLRSSLAINATVDITQDQYTALLADVQFSGTHTYGQMFTSFSGATFQDATSATDYTDNYNQLNWFSSGTASGHALKNYYGFLQVGAGTVDQASVFYGTMRHVGGTLTTATYLWGEAIGGVATNAYHQWADEQGVFRIKADNTFNSVYQAITALYNPQFTKYTPGATNYERVVQYWDTNVATYGTEAGGIGAQRVLNLIGSSVKANGNTVLVNGGALGTPASGTLTNATGLPEAGLSLSDVTTANVSAAAHGFAPKFPNNTTTFLRGDGTYAIPPGTGTGTVTSVALSVPSVLSISGSPVTTSGTLAIGYSGTALPVANGGTAATSAGIAAFNNITGYSAAGSTGTTTTNLVFSTSPSFTTPILGTPQSGDLSNCTALPVGSITGLGTGVATFLATPSSANLASAVTDETGSGVLVFGTSPTFTTGVTVAGGTVTGTSGTTLVASITGTANPSSTSTLVYQALKIAPTINYAAGTPGAGSYEALKIAVTETAAPTGTNYFMRCSAGAAGTTDKLTIDNTGSVTGTSAGSVSGFFSMSATKLRVTSGATLEGIATGLTVCATSTLGFSSTASNATSGPDAFFSRGGAAATVQLGADVNGAAVSQMFTACNGITGTDKTGGTLTIASGKGTGAGAVSSLIVQTPTVLGTGTTAQSLATRLTISSAGATFAAGITTIGGATFHTTSSALTDGAGVGLGTLGTAPAAGNPTKWIGINDNGTTRYIPAW